MDDRQVVAVGLLLCLLGVLLVFVPSLGTAALPTLAATLLAAGVVGLGLVVALSYVANPEAATVDLPAPERRPYYRRPGAAFADRLSAVGLTGRRRVATERAEADGDRMDTPRERLHADLQDLAVAVLTRTTGCSRGEALARLDEGEWTDDAEAAAFLAGGLTPSLSWRHRVPGVSSRELPVVRRARRTVATLAETAVGGHPDTDQRASTGAKASEYWPTESLPTTRSTGRTRQATIAALLASGVGVFAGSPGMVLVATLGVTLAGAARFSSPTPSVTLSRTVETTQPDPGEKVAVTVTVRNDGDRTLADLRLLDGVPAGLTVVEDSPRMSTALRPGKATTFTYTVEAVDGTHTFEPAILIASDFVGATERVETVAPADDQTELTCGFGASDDEVDSPRAQVTMQSGLVEADASGTGVEFDTVREYRPGDPPGRIDWHHRAKTGDLSTVDFSEPRQPKTGVLVDARPDAYVASATDGVPAPRHAARAAARLADGLLAAVRPVGLATVGTDRWIPPRGGDDQRTTLRRTLAGAEAVPWTPPTETVPVEDAVARLRARFTPETQVLVCSPLADDDSVELCRRLDAAGHAVTVVTPDCTDTETAEGAYGACQRWRRCSTLRGADIPVRDWRPSEPIPEVMARAAQF